MFGPGHRSLMVLSWQFERLLNKHYGASPYPAPLTCVL
ncbi:Uncharacterized protein ABJ99_1681 [Pseudomonas syringae pv. cilantro]|uniref:Uncharacterized protein n=2 Tax=Pseudomonas syringae group TaxID=136849 RepID=A0A0N0GG14_PSESX|nr:Uncharacterized protein ABJ99_1681 [Pseudomonas syringae pv. cilantro]KPW72384.1 hypothetical protein ALO76_102426 [Pseudomonas syringae pv. coriandricola]RMN11982.1 hypothetical protein ALQ65_102256 [Pseudomonas syringae pv. coriandricola]